MRMLLIVSIFCTAVLFSDESKDEIIIPKLNGLVFYAHQEDVEVYGDLYLKGIKSENISIPNEKDFLCKMR